ncbi:MAG TPA: hypothetical protein VHH36_04305 [Candidatus Thermoplasmatota archaeon]|nr:hypothetical protein [Candidatus Thermoplasmatota archaeon]
MKTIRFELPVLDADDVDDLLDLVTDVEGVVAAEVDARLPALDVVVASDACALLVREELVGALGASWPGAAA